MMTIDGINLHGIDSVQKITINGYHVYANGSRKVRFPGDNNWMDIKHQAVIKAIQDLELALAAVVNE